MAEQRTAGFIDSTCFFFFYIQKQSAEPGDGGDAARLFNFISEWIAACGDFHLFVYRLLQVRSVPLPPRRGPEMDAAEFNAASHPLPHLHTHTDTHAHLTPFIYLIISCQWHFLFLQRDVICVFSSPRFHGGCVPNLTLPNQITFICTL